MAIIISSKLAWRTANGMVQRYGSKALKEARRCAALAPKGEVELWEAVIRALEELFSRPEGLPN